MAVMLLVVSSLPVYAQGGHPENGQPEKNGTSVDVSDESAGENSSEVNEAETNENNGNVTENPEINNPAEGNGEVSGAPEEAVTGDSATGNSEQADKGETPADEEKVMPSIGYRTHVQDYGWQDWKKDGATAGTTGEAKRLEAIQIQIENASDLAYEGGVEYHTHVQDYGWESNWASNGGMSGTSGQAKRLEAIQVRLTGELAEHYDIYYRVHAEDYGWLGWAKNGEKAGTSCYGKRLEAIEIMIVEKDAAISGSTDNHYVCPKVRYQTHVQDIGWQDKVSDGATAGTTGQNKRLEAVKIALYEQEYDGGVEYQTHIQDIGWEQDWKSDDTMSGTSGQAKRLEAIRIRLTGEMEQHYDVYYRVHAEDFGWLGWTSNGNSAGTEGLGKKLEAIQIKLVPKGSSVDTSERPFIRKYKDSEISFWGNVENTGHVTAPYGQIIGTTGQNLRLEGFGINLDQSSSEVLGGEIQYRAYCQDYGWKSWVSQGNFAGTKDESKRMEAVQIKLTGDLAKYYNVCYRTHVQNYGWLGWARNGATAGTTGLSYRIEALEIRLVPKNEGGPSGGGSAYRSTLVVPAQNGSGLSSFGSYSMTIGMMTKLNNAINNFTRNGHRVGFYMLDLYSGNGIYYNSNESFYGASTVKGPYVVSLNEKVPNSPNETGSTMRSCIKVSDNNAYVSLRNRYGNAPFASFASEAGCTGLNTNRKYIDFTARQLAQLWVKNYQFFYSGKANSTFCRDLFTGTLNSPISNTLGKTYTVYSKAGWIGEGGHNNVQNDAGVVMRNGHPYVIVMLSSAYGQLGWLNTLTSAINDAHEELIANSN